MTSKIDQRSLELLYENIVEDSYREVMVEAKLPSSRFRKENYSETRTIYKLYLKRSSSRQFIFVGEFDTLEGAVEAFHRGHEPGMFRMREKPENYEYNIKEVNYSYSEKTIKQSPVADLRDKLPELKGII